MESLQSKDFRLGNLVNYTNGGIFKVIGIHDFGLDVEDEIEITYMELENFEPIPLTEEWLVKLGAKTSGNNQIVYDRFLLTWKPEYKYWYVVCVNTLAYMTKIEYVHEWQNFVYVMNNQELTIKHN